MIPRSSPSNTSEHAPGWIAIPQSLTLSRISHYHNPSGMHPVPISCPPQTLRLELLTGGRGWVLQGEEWIEVREGFLLWHVPGEQTIGRSDFENPYRCLAVHFHYKGVFHRLIPRITRWADIDEVRQFTDQMVAHAYEDDFDPSVLAVHIFGELQYRAYHYAWTREKERLPAPLLHVGERIEKDYARDLKLEDMARAAGWSVPHLHDRFQKQFGLSPHQALIARRIRAAKVRLASSNDPIKQIALECGFSSAGSFCTTFRRRTGRTPAVFRRERMSGIPD